MWTHPRTDAEIIAIAEAWVDDLARADYRQAYSRTDHDPNYDWTPSLIQAVVAGYGLPEPHRSGEIFKVTDRNAATGHQHQKTVERNEIADASLAEVWYDLPLNGEWSDRTATSRVSQRDGRWYIVLEQIHVF